MSGYNIMTMVEELSVPQLVHELFVEPITPLGQSDHLIVILVQMPEETLAAPDLA